MNKEQSGKGKISDQQVAAIIASVMVIGFFVIYWVVQIVATKNILDMIYG